MKTSFHDTSVRVRGAALLAWLVLGGHPASAITLMFDAQIQSSGSEYSQVIEIDDTPNIFDDMSGVTHWRFPVTSVTTATTAETETIDSGFIGAHFEAFNDGNDLTYLLTYPIGPILTGEPVNAVNAVLINSFLQPALDFDANGAVAADVVFAIQFTRFVDLGGFALEGSGSLEHVVIDPASITVPEPSVPLFAFASLLICVRRRR